jgi:hypothetical protein
MRRPIHKRQRALVCVIGLLRHIDRSDNFLSMNEGLELRNYGKEGKNTPILFLGIRIGGLYVFA